MKQSTLSVTLEVDPGSCERLSALIDALKQQEESAPHGIPEKYDRLRTSLPALHFMSISVFPGWHYDPLLVLEVNFDGAPGVFWGQLEAALGEPLREMLRCCKRPRDDAGPLYDAVTAPGSRAPVAPYFEARTLRPSVFHHGNRGMTRQRIIDEGALFGAVRDTLAEPADGARNPYRGLPAEQLHAKLRAAVVGAHPWLDERAPARIPLGERLGDILRLLVFALAAMLVLSIPGLVLAPLLPPLRFAILFGVLALIVYAALYRMHRPQPGTGAPRRSGGLSLWNMKLLTIIKTAAAFLLFVAVYVALATAILAALAVPLAGQEFWAAARLWAVRALLALGAALFFSAPALLLWLRWLERRDSSQDQPPTATGLIREMAKREDWIPQNHMGSIVLVKPGVLRTALFRAGHRGLGLVLRVVATDGYLGSMRTVHFAHWAFINNGSRLMFFSNFDHSWESYLDDFIEKAHGGLTLAWGSCVGFPPTRFLVIDGASHGRKFKNWARHSMAVSRFWYSAYRDYTVDQIERHARIAEGLRKKTLGRKGAEAWALDL
jgi:hypothetical protein